MYVIYDNFQRRDVASIGQKKRFTLLGAPIMKKKTILIEQKQQCNILPTDKRPHH